MIEDRDQGTRRGRRAHGAIADTAGLGQRGPAALARSRSGPGGRMGGAGRAVLPARAGGPRLEPPQRRWLAVLAGLLCCGLLLFIRGFLLTRFEVADRSQCNSDSVSEGDSATTHGIDGNTAAAGCWMPRRFDTAVFVIIDALRYDFAAPDAQVDEHSEAYRGHVPVIGHFLEQQPQNSRLYRFIADGPTTTLQRLKGLTTGSLPTFIDVGSNFNSDAIEEDNWVAQLGAHGWHLSFSGDDTWTKVFPRGFTEAHPYPSFNVKDLHGVDNGVKKHLLPSVRERMKIQSAARTSPNANASVGSIVIGHYLGVDHVGHRFGPTHPEMKTKLEQMNSELTELLETVDESTVVFVMGDHGMTATGDHGGETRDEVEAALFAYTPAGFGHAPASALGLGFGTADGMGSMYQTDLVPTLALALGVPIPFGNLGGALTELILPPRTAEREDELEWHGWTIVALHANAKQVWRYLQSYQAKSQAFPPETVAQFRKKMAAIQNSYDALGLQISAKLTDKLTYRIPLGKDAAEMHHQLAVDLASFLREAAAVCREHFATFDMGDMVVGLLAMSVTLASAVMVGIVTLCFSLRSKFAQVEGANEAYEIPTSPMQSFVKRSGASISTELRLGPPALPSKSSSRVRAGQPAALGSVALDCGLGMLGLIPVIIWLGGDGLGRGLVLGCVTAAASYSTRQLIGPAVSELRESWTTPGMPTWAFTLCCPSGQCQLEQTIGAATLIILHAVSCLSNSFVDAEPEVIRYLLSTGIVVLLVRRVYALNPHGKQRSHALRIAALLLVVVRMSPMLTVQASHEKLETIATSRVEGYMPLEYSEEIVNQYVGSSLTPGLGRWVIVGLEVLGVGWIKSFRVQAHMPPQSEDMRRDCVSIVHSGVLCVSILAVFGYYLELKINARHPTAAAVPSQITKESTVAFDGIGGIGWHLMLPRIAYSALLFGLLSLAANRSHPLGQATWRTRLLRTTSLLAILDALLLGPLSPPALISMGVQCWLLLQLRESLHNVDNNVARGNAYASPVDACGRSSTPPSSPPRKGVKYLGSFHSGGDAVPDPEMGLYGEVSLFTALWLLTGRQYFFITGHTNAFAKIDVTASFVGFHDVHSELGMLRSVVLVAINTYGTQIMAWISCALLSTKQLVPSSGNGGDTDRMPVFDHTMTDPVLRGASTSQVLLCMLWQGVASLFASICAAVHRRHLMMWAIFAPKFCFEGVALFLSTAIFMIVLAWSYTTGRVCDPVQSKPDVRRGKAAARSE